jgi:hypothetical protein
MNTESAAPKAELETPLAHLEQGLDRKSCLMAIAFCVEMETEKGVSLKEVA